MAVDKLVDSVQLDADLTSVADAIRLKSGGSSPLSFPAGFISEIANIPAGGGGLPETLIGNGTFNVSAVSSSFTFPITYSGTPTQLFVTKDSADAGVGETLAWISITPDLLIVSDAFPLDIRLLKIKNADDGIGYMANFNLNTGLIHFSAANGAYDAGGTYMTIRQYGNNNRIRPGDYHWYIYGNSI